MKIEKDSSRNQGLTVLGPEDRFQFACLAGLDCFTKCCRDTTIFLTPYDILRLKNALGISSETFLKDFTVGLVNDAGLPVVVLKLQEDDTKSCPFVTPEGCRVYADRPWACRIFPLRPEQKPSNEKADEVYHSLMDVPFCLGFFQNQESTVSRWQETQGIPIYREMEKRFAKITLNPFLSDKCVENEKIRNMVYMACYDLDRFRRFVFESSFLQRFETDPVEVENIRQDDVALYAFAMRWLEFGLIGQHVMTVKPDTMAAKKRELGIR